MWLGHQFLEACSASVTPSDLAVSLLYGLSHLERIQLCPNPLILHSMETKTRENERPRLESLWSMTSPHLNAQRFGESILRMPRVKELVSCCVLGRHCVWTTLLSYQLILLYRQRAQNERWNLFKSHMIRKWEAGAQWAKHWPPMHEALSLSPQNIHKAGHDITRP